MKKMILLFSVLVFLSASVICIGNIAAQDSVQYPQVSAAMMVRLLLFSIGGLASFVLALIAARQFFLYNKSLKEQVALDLDELTLNSMGPESIFALLSRLGQDLNALVRNQDPFIDRLDAYLQEHKNDTRKIDSVDFDENDSVGSGAAEEKMNVLREMAKTITHAGNRADLFDRVIRIAAGVTHSRRASVMLLDDARSGLLLQCALGWEPDPDSRTAIFPLEEGLAGSVIREGKRMLVSDVKAETGRDNKDGYRSSSFMILPFSRNGEVVGVINLTDRMESDFYEYDELDLLNHLLDLLSLALLQVG